MTQGADLIASQDYFDSVIKASANLDSNLLATGILADDVILDLVINRQGQNSYESITVSRDLT